MQQYLNLLKDIQDNGVFTGDRTGTGTQSVFGRQLRFDMKDGFPLLTTKKLYTRAIIHELLWFISGSTNTKYLTDNDVNIWNEWADENGDLGPVYGAQWRAWPKGESCTTCYGSGKLNDAEAGDIFYDEWDCPDCNGRGEFVVDQLAQVIEGIRTNPNGRRHIISAWNVPQIQDMALPPCHCLMQFKVYGDKLHLQLYQRSADVFLGVPFNVASYALLLGMVAQVTGLKAGEFIHTFGDVHIYNNHQEQVTEQLTRKPYMKPTLLLNPDVKEIDDFTFDDIEIKGYTSWPSIKGEVSV